MEAGNGQTIYEDKSTVDDENGLPIYYTAGKVVTKMKHGLQMTVRTLMEIQNQPVRFILSHVCPSAPTSFRRAGTI